jgi:hypothetical protein
MSRRPAPLGLTKDTSEGRAYSQGSTPLSLSSDITSVRYGDYPGLVRFINKYPRTADTQEINRLLTQASVHETAGESSLAATCVHHAIALKKWRNLGPQEAGKYFESLAEGGKTTTEFMSDITKVLTALQPNRYRASMTTGITQSQTRAFRENDERLYYIDKQGDLLQPASNRQNPEPSRTLSDPATDDPNIRAYGTTLTRHDPVLPSRHNESRRRSQGEPELPLKSYFLPKEGINDDVIERDITRRLGATASVRPHVSNVSFQKKKVKTCSHLRRADQDTSSKLTGCRQL